MVLCKDCEYFQRIYFWDDDTNDFTDPAMSGKCSVLFAGLQLFNNLTFLGKKPWHGIEERYIEIAESFGCVLGRRREKEEKMPHKKSYKILEEKRKL
jgi:hypothetical protein